MTGDCRWNHKRFKFNFLSSGSGLLYLFTIVVISIEGYFKTKNAVPTINEWHDGPKRIAGWSVQWYLFKNRRERISCFTIDFFVGTNKPFYCFSCWEVIQPLGNIQTVWKIKKENETETFTRGYRSTERKKCPHMYVFCIDCDE